MLTTWIVVLAVSCSLGLAGWLVVRALDRSRRRSRAAEPALMVAADDGWWDGFATWVGDSVDGSSSDCGGGDWGGDGGGDCGGGD